MRPTRINHIKVWCHCLMHLHRKANYFGTMKQIDKTTFALIGDLEDISCLDCNYGNKPVAE